MEEFRNAEVKSDEAGAIPGTVEQAANPFEITTDDLVLMIGEYTLKERQYNRITAVRDRQFQAMQQALLKTQSLLAEAERARSDLQNQVGSMTSTEETIRKSEQSLRDRILALEDQLHATALERDTHAARIAELEAENRSIRQEASAAKAAAAAKPTTPAAKSKSRKSEIRDGGTWPS
jgi:chromosome segregation ATPase